MIPFMKPKMQTGIIFKERKAEGGISEAQDDDSMAMEACADDMIRAIHSKDSKMLAKAMKAAFDIMEASPHEEGPHLNEENE